MTYYASTVTWNGNYYSSYDKDWKLARHLFSSVTSVHQ